MYLKSSSYLQHVLITFWLYRVGDFYGIRVGDMVIKYRPYVATTVQLPMRLLNFTYNVALNDPDSTLYQQYEENFCSEVGKFIEVVNKNIYVLVLSVLSTRNAFNFVFS